MKTSVTIIFLLLFQMATAQSNSKKFLASVESSKKAETAWELISDTSQWKSWDKTVVDSRFQGPLEEKGKGTLIAPGGKINEFKVVALEKGKSYTFNHKVSSGVLFVKRTVESTASGSKITEEVWYKGISRKTFQKYYGSDFEQQLEKKLSSLKSLLEGV